jgi:hypothetical protein
MFGSTLQAVEWRKPLREWEKRSLRLGKEAALRPCA